MPLTADLQRNLNEALKAGRRTEVDTIRFLVAALRNLAIEKRVPLERLEDSQTVEVIGRQVKQRRESIAAFEKGGREDLARKEREEMAVLERYLPAQLTEAELTAVVERAAAETGAAGPGDMGKVMAKVMPQVKGRADGSVVNRIVRARLGAA